MNKYENKYISMSSIDSIKLHVNENNELKSIEVCDKDLMYRTGLMSCSVSYWNVANMIETLEPFVKAKLLFIDKFKIPKGTDIATCRYTRYKGQKWESVEDYVFNAKFMAAHFDLISINNKAPRTGKVYRAKKMCDIKPLVHK